MRKFFNGFRQLHWKLTLTYTLVSIAAIILFEILATIAVIQILMVQANTQGPIYLQNVSEKISPLVKQSASWDVFDKFFHPVKRTNQQDIVVVSEFFDFTLAFDDSTSDIPDKLKQTTILIEIPNSQDTVSDKRKDKDVITAQASDSTSSNDSKLCSNCILDFTL